jgi:hypothetical protein
MRYVGDPTMSPGRVIVKEAGDVVAVATNLHALPVISDALQRGDEVHAHPETLPFVDLWIIGRERLAQMMRAEHKRRSRRGARRGDKGDGRLKEEAVRRAREPAAMLENGDVVEVGGRHYRFRVTFEADRQDGG